METRVVAAGTAAVLVDICATGCAGIWLDDADMELGLDITDDLQPLAIAPSQTPDGSQPAACPVCQTDMARFRWNYTSPVTLDQCPDGHGTWVDGGEVQAMEEYEEHEVLSPMDQSRLRARIGMDQLELRAAHVRPSHASSAPLFSLIEMLAGRSL
jgi:Zn-finger nucleic acid-binding protein